MGGDDQSLLNTSFDVTFYGLPAAGPTASTDRAHQNHSIMEAKVIQQLISTITGLVAIGTKSGQCQRIEHPVWSKYFQ